jgi:hypothetical protein
MQIRCTVTVETIPKKRTPSEYNLFQASVKGMGYSKKQIGELWKAKKLSDDSGVIIESNDLPEKPQKPELYGAAKLMKEMKGCKGIKMTDVTKQLKGAKGLCTKK